MAYEHIFVIIKGKSYQVEKFLLKGIVKYTRVLNNRKKILNSKYLKIKGIKSKGNIEVKLYDDVISIDLDNLIILSEKLNIYYKISITDWQNTTTEMTVNNGKIIKSRL